LNVTFSCGPDPVVSFAKTGTQVSFTDAFGSKNIVAQKKNINNNFSKKWSPSKWNAKYRNKNANIPNPIIKLSATPNSSGKAL
jgi:hypothetical protein